MLFAFDCDGVLVDSEVIASEVDAEMLTKIGFPITAQDVSRRFAGLTAKAIFDLVEADLGHPVPDEFHKEQKAELDKRLAKELKGIPGVAEMLDRIEGPRCVCSNSSDERLRLSLTKMEDEGLGKGKMQAVSTSQRPRVPHQDDPSSDAPPPISYTEERAKRVLYSDPELHLTVGMSACLNLLQPAAAAAAEGGSTTFFTLLAFCLATRAAAID